VEWKVEGSQTYTNRATTGIFNISFFAKVVYPLQTQPVATITWFDGRDVISAYNVPSSAWRRESSLSYNWNLTNVVKMDALRLPSNTDANYRIQIVVRANAQAAQRDVNTVLRRSSSTPLPSTYVPDVCGSNTNNNKGEREGSTEVTRNNKRLVN